MNHPSLMQLNTDLHALVVFRRLLEDDVIARFSALLDAPLDQPRRAVSLYADFASALFAHTDNWSDYLLRCVLEDENLYMQKKAQRLPVDACIEQCVDAELALLQQLSLFDGSLIRSRVSYDGFWAQWHTRPLDFSAIYQDRLAHIGEHGYGLFAKHHMFIVRDGQILPIQNPDPVRLCQLSGYAYQRDIVIRNTRALLAGKPAANTLLYGDSGTGKSSSVKAIANEFRDQGLRLIELKKSQLHEIPALIDRLSANPLKFILFIDDLSFASDDDNFAALKAILEGSVSSTTNNIVVYATSNRRHMVKETFSDRQGDEIHVNDTIQELVSLSERFGLTVTFTRPDKNAFIDIVCDLAQQYAVSLDRQTLVAQAEAYALARGGRSPRVAKQFVESLKAQEME